VAAAAALVLLAGILLFLSLPDVTPLAASDPGPSALMRQREREALRAGKSWRPRREWVPLSGVPLLLQQAVRVSEDAGFYAHRGLDFHEIRESFRRNLAEGKVVRGGSTITQQLAKNLYLSTSRDPLRKVREVLIALRLERRLSKNRILELYLNVIELGPGIFGVQAASRAHFGKSCRDLSPGEIARLTAVIPRPLTASPLARSGWVRWRAGWILDLLLRYGYLDPETHRREKAALG
jgi:monofunctional biosynthetic peptidoglycan transglycosylase